MDKLLSVITDFISKQKPEKLESLATLVKQCENSKDSSKLSNWIVTSQSKQELSQLVNAWKLSSISSNEMAGMILGASYAYHQAKEEEKVELVWTGPATPMMSARRTEQALLEVINSANEILFLVSFVAYEVASITSALNEAISRGVSVSILMEPAEEHGGQIKNDCFSTMRYAVPQASLFVWSEQSKEEMGGGYQLVHAKCSVADSKLAFITSANLSGAALERNMELGVLLSGNNVPKKLNDHLQSLITTKIIIPYK